MTTMCECDAGGLQVPEVDAVDWISLTMDGKTYDFSSRACLELFVCPETQKAPAEAGEGVTL